MNELRTLATAQFVLTTHVVDANEQDVSKQEPKEEVKTLREAMES